MESISSPIILMQVLDFLKIISLTEKKPTSNKLAVLELAGTINDAEATEVRGIIDEEFNNIEGDW
ncbi:MAG: hypothetical protein AAFN81_35585 [Bacteroidota bacterium]